MISYRFLDEVRTTWIEDVNALVGELTKQEGGITREQFLLMTMKNRWLVAMDANEKIVGMATLIPMLLPTGLIGRIEDVVVLSSEQGNGLGRELLSRLIVEAKRSRMKFVTLTSKPERTSANALYIKLGFVRFETNNYRLVF